MDARGNRRLDGLSVCKLYVRQILGVGERRHQWRMGGMDIKRFEALKDSPLTDAVSWPS